MGTRLGPRQFISLVACGGIERVERLLSGAGI